MANTNLNVRMKHVVKTETEWNATTSKPLKGEICITDPSGRIKIGDGTNLWSALPYIDASNITALSNSGSTITYTKADGSTGTITLPSYSVATSSTPGLVKSGTDISVDSSGNVSVVDNSHNHTIANVTNLQTSLDAKAPKASPALTGTPTAPTATAGTNTTQIATTAFVQNAIGNTEIGGRNYVQKSTSFKVGGYGTGGLVASVESDGTYKMVASANNGNWATGWYDNLTGIEDAFQEDENFVISFLIKSNDCQTTTPPRIYIKSGMGYFSLHGSVTANYSLVYYIGTWKKANTLQPHLGWGSCVGTYYIKAWKIEKGNKPTDWTPAPEDLVSNISLSGTTLSYSNPLGTQLGSYTLSKSSVGLGNVDNTSDANKPISTATQTALDQLALAKADVADGTEYIVGTQTGTTGSWTGVTKSSALYDGKQISYFLPYAGSGNASLNLTLSGGGTTGAKPVYRWGTTYVTTHYGANSLIRMTYNSTKNAWFVDADYDSNTTPAYLEYRNNTYAKTALVAETVIVGDKDGYSSVASGVTFDLSYPILWTTGAVSAGSSNYANMFTQHYDRTLGNVKSGFSSTAKKMIYLVVTISGNTATIDSSIITDTLPTSDDGKAYIVLGRLGAQSTGANYFLFQAAHPIFVYRKGALRVYSGSADVVNGHTVEADVPSDAVFTDSNVNQKLTTADDNYPLLLSNQSIGVTTSEVVSWALRNNSLYYNPTTKLLTTTKIRSGNTCYNVCQAQTTNTPVETILYTGIKWVSSTHMPVIHITGFAYGLQSPVEFKIAFYIYDNKIGWCGAQNMGAWSPNIYLFKYTKNNVNYVAVGLAGSCYFLQLSVNVQDEMGKMNNISFADGLWSWSFLTSTGTIPADDSGVTCISVPYKVNYNPKPTLTIQGADTTIDSYNGTATKTINITKSSIGLGNVENKSSATIRGELTSSNVTTALGYTPANVTALDSYVLYGGNDTGLGSGTTAAKAKEYFADATKIAGGKIKFYYNTYGSEKTTVFSKAPNGNYGSVLNWGYEDQYLRILRYRSNSWQSEDWEKIYAGYADSAGNATTATTATEAKALITLGDNRSVATTPDDYKNKIVFAGLKTNTVINSPSSDTYSYIIGLRGWEDNSGGKAYEFALNNTGIYYRLENTNTTWNGWDRILTKIYGDTLYPLKSNVPAIHNSASYLFNKSIYVGGSGNKKYARITLPNSFATMWGMYYFEVSIRNLHGDSRGGKVFIACYHSSTSPYTWTISATTVGNLLSNGDYAIKVYASDGKYIYIYLNTAYTNVSLDRMLVGDTASGYDVSGVTLDFVETLPETYQTATMYHSLTTNNITNHLSSSNITTALGYTPVNKAGDTMTGDLFTKGSGETKVGVKYVSNSSEGNLYFWGNYSSGTRGVYDSKKGYIIQVSDSTTTFTGNLSGNVTGNVSGKAGYTHEVRQIETYNFNSRATSANINSNNNGGLRVVLATNSMTATNGKPDYDSHIIHLDWDNSSTYASQLAVGNYGVNGRIAVRAQNADQTWTGWSYVYDTVHKPTANDVGALSLTGGTLTGGLTIRNNALYLSNTVTNLTAADNGSSNTIYHSIWGIDKDNRSWFCVEGYTNSSGTVAAFLGVRNYNTSGTAQSWKGITITEAKDNTLTYTISDPASFRSAIASPAMTTETYPALLPTNGSNNWIKVGTSNTSYGLLPSQGGSIGSGHNYLGTSSWYWGYGYIDNIYSSVIEIGLSDSNEKLHLNNNFIGFQNAQAQYQMIRFLGGPDANGHGISIGGGGRTIIGGGEAASTIDGQTTNWGDEAMIIAGDGGIDFYSNCQNGFSSAYNMSLTSAGNLYVGTTSSTDTVFHEVVARNKVCSASLHAGAGGNHGLYSNTKGGWLIYTPNSSSDNAAYIPRNLNVSGSITATVSSGEADVIASNGTNKIYLYANTSGTVGIYSYDANGTARAIIARANNAHTITAYGGWTFGSGDTHDSGIIIRNTGLTKGTNPSSEQNRAIVFTDKEGYSSTQNDVISAIYGGGVSTSGVTYTFVRTYQYTTANANYAQLSVNYSTTPYVETNCGFFASGFIISTVTSGEAYVMARNSSTGNRIFIDANSSNGTAGLYSYDASNTARAILVRANNSEAITGYGSWTFPNSIYIGAANNTYNQYVHVRNSSQTIALHAGTSGNAGVYSETKSKWLIYINSSGTVTANTSDIRYKNVIDNMSDKEALDILRGINIINFTYKDDENKIVQNGIIAQQLRDILINNKYGYRPYLSIQSTQTSKTYYDLNMPEDNIQYGIDYGRMVPTLWKGWQILDNTITIHEDRLTKLENENKQLKKKIAMLENQLKGA